MKVRKLFSPMILIIFLIAALISMAFRPMFLQTGGGDLSEGQLMIIGIVASAIVWILKLLASQGFDPSKEVVAIALYVVAFVLAIWFTPVSLPPFPPFTDAPTFIAGLLAYIGQLLALAAPIVGIAYLVYNVLLQRVLEAVRARIRSARG